MFHLHLSVFCPFSLSFTSPFPPLTLQFLFFSPLGSSKFLWNIHPNMNEENAVARAEIKISLFTALEFGNAISICTVWPRDIYCFGLPSFIVVVLSSHLADCDAITCSLPLAVSDMAYNYTIFECPPCELEDGRRGYIMQWLHFKTLVGETQSILPLWRLYLGYVRVVISLYKCFKRKNENIHGGVMFIDAMMKVKCC